MGKEKLRYNQKELTAFLRQVASEAETVNDDGDLVTNAEKLARVIWKKALGYVESQNRNGETFEKIHPPTQWAIQLLMERLEGKVANAVEDKEQTVTAADRVGELCVETVNRLTEQVAPAPKGPPPLRPKSEGSDDG